MSLKSLVSDGLRNFTLGRHVHITSPQLACVSTWSGESKTELLKHRSTGRPKPRRSKSLYEGRNIEVDQGDLQLEVILTIRVDGKKTQNKKTHTKKKPITSRSTTYLLRIGGVQGAWFQCWDGSIGSWIPKSPGAHGARSRLPDFCRKFLGGLRKLWLEVSLWSLNSTW